MTQTPGDDPTVRFFEAEDLGHRDWGTETLIACIPNVCTGKILEIRAGCKGGLQKHRLKNESAYLVKGSLLVRYDDGSKTLKEKVLKPGDCVSIPPGAVHQEEALTDCTIFEVSTPHFNDRVRMEADYGLPVSGGLPTTELDDIQMR